MNSTIRFLCVILLSALFFISCKTTKTTDTATVQLKTLNDTISYIIGADVAGNLKKNNIEINPDIFVYAFNKNIKTTDSLLSPELRQKIMTKFQKELQVKQQTITLAESQKNKLAGQVFFAKNKEREEVVELPSGLQYKIINTGTGPKPGPEDEVTVNYEGKFLDGKIFDSSYERKEPVTFPLNGVIKGWTEGLQLMNVGSVYEFYIPSELGYGDKGYGQIPGGMALIFKVELISVKAK